MKKTGFENEYRIQLIDNCFITCLEEKKETGPVLGFAKDNRGIGVVEIVLILVVLVALVIIFKDKIIELVNSAFSSISSDAESL